MSRQEIKTMKQAQPLPDDDEMDGYAKQSFIFGYQAGVDVAIDHMYDKHVVIRKALEKIYEYGPITRSSAHEDIDNIQKIALEALRDEIRPKEKRFAMRKWRP